MVCDIRECGKNDLKQLFCGQCVVRCYEFGQSLSYEQ